MSAEPQSQHRWKLVEQVAAHFIGGETEDHAPGCLIPFNTNDISWGTLHWCMGSKARSVPELAVPIAGRQWPQGGHYIVLEGVCWMGCSGEGVCWSGSSEEMSFEMSLSFIHSSIRHLLIADSVRPYTRWVRFWDANSRPRGRYSGRRDQNKLAEMERV